MDEQLRLMAVLAHPDDESLGVGGTLARYASEGIATALVTATRGERGRYFTNEDRPSDEDVGRVREDELRAAAQQLGVGDLAILGYHDGELDSAEPGEAIVRIVEHIRRLRPHVVITFDPYGGYGHPDHVAICQFGTAAVTAAADPEIRTDAAAHRVAKLYYFVFDDAKWSAYQEAFKKLTSTVDGVERSAVAWPEWAISARIDTSEHWETVWAAVQCHRTQLAIYARLGELTAEHHTALWGSQKFYRAMSLVNGGRETETDLFEGLR